MTSIWKIGSRRFKKTEEEKEEEEEKEGSLGCFD